MIIESEFSQLKLEMNKYRILRKYQLILNYMRKWQVLHIAIISNFKTLLKVSFEKCSKLTRVDRLESPEGVSSGQKCSNMSAQGTLYVNICNQYVISNHSIIFTFSIRPSTIVWDPESGSLTQIELLRNR